MDAVQRWKVIKHWPLDVNFFTESITIEGTPSNEANHEEWQRNGVDSIDDEIGKLKNVKRLTLWDLPLKNISGEIGKMESLEYFKVYNCGIPTYKDEVYACDLKIPEGIADSKTLKTLSIINTRITELPERIGQLVSFEQLDCSNTSIVRIPESITSLKSLKEIDLSLNEHLINIPGELKSIGLNTLSIKGTLIGKNVEFVKEFISSNLNCSVQADCLDQINFFELLDNANIEANTYLNLKSKKITNIPACLIKASNLEKLDLSYNRFESLTEELFQLNSLKSLDLNGNGFLKEVSESLGKLTHLTELNIGSAGITNLPASIGDLKELETLLLSGCKNLVELPGTISNLKNLNI